jgi:hypothetical protein
MDYGDILKRAWRVTWRYKALWVLGFFAGAGASSGNSGSRTSTTTGSSPFGSAEAAQFQSFLTQYAPIIFVAFLVALVIGIIFMVVSVAARGGLIHLVNEAEEGREVRLGDGWRAGFSKWWRLFGVTFVAGLPVTIILTIILVIIGVAGFGAYSSYIASGGGGSTTEVVRALAAPLAGAFCFVFVFAIIAVFVGIVLGIAANLGLRYVMLEDRGAMASLKQGWSDVWSKRGAAVMFWVMAAISIAIGIVFGGVAAIFAVPAIAMSGSGSSAAATSMAGLVGLVLLVPAAIYGTFVEASWTVFFRRMTGRMPVSDPALAAPTMPSPPVYAQPAGFIPPAPPAPPAAPMGYQPPPMPAEPVPPMPAEPPMQPLTPPAPPMPPAQPEPPAPMTPADVPPPPSSDV